MVFHPQSMNHQSFNHRILISCKPLLYFRFHCFPCRTSWLIGIPLINYRLGWFTYLFHEVTRLGGFTYLVDIGVVSVLQNPIQSNSPDESKYKKEQTENNSFIIFNKSVPSSPKEFLRLLVASLYMKPNNRICN